MELRVENLIYEYNAGTAYAKRALNGIDLEFHEGEFIGLIGHTGSGKSTLIQHLNGLLEATQGRVTWNGVDIYGNKFNRRDFRGHVGLVFQYPEYQLFETEVLKDVCFGPKNLGFSEDECEVRAKEALALVGMGEEYYKKSPFDLSGGQKRRVAIAGVLAMRSEFLILDEPTAGLDPRGRDEILGSIAGIQKESGSTVILVSHSMDDIAQYVNRLIVIDAGKIIFDDRPENVFSNIEKLEEVGLAAPQISYILRDLNKEGFDLDPSLIRLEDAKASILKELERKR